ncbi:MAG: hypothetical protein QM723_06990 [Myxococcaceae bacterium]
MKALLYIGGAYLAAGAIAYGVSRYKFGATSPVLVLTWPASVKALVAASAGAPPVATLSTPPPKQIYYRG